MEKPERDMRDGWRHAASHDLVRLVLLELMEPLKHDMSEERYVNDEGQQAKVAYAKYIYNRVREVDEPLAARLLGDCLGGIGWDNWQTKSQAKQSSMQEAASPQRALETQAQVQAQVDKARATAPEHRPNPELDLQ